MFFSRTVVKADTNQPPVTDVAKNCELELKAIRQNTAYIAFTPDGHILDTNALFLQTVGYRLDEIIGQHHRIFCDTAYSTSPSYKEFWLQLAAGKLNRGIFQRYKKDGSVLYLQASYFPVLDEHGHVIKVIKIAEDITANHQALQNKQAQLAALDKSMAVIEFSPDGTVLHANHNFLQVMGYRLEQIVGQHHRMFCDDDFSGRTQISGAHWRQGNIWGGVLCGVIRKADLFGLKQPTIPSSMKAARW